MAASYRHLGQEDPVQEKREHAREEIHTPVSYERQGENATGYAKDISMGGMFIQADWAPPFGTKLTVRCQLPRSKAEIQLPSIVRWAKDDGFGVQFGLLGARETHAIAQLLDPKR